MVQRVKLMRRTFEFAVLLFDCFVYCQNVTCLKSLRGGHYAGDTEDIMLARFAAVSQIAVPN